jgi:hypothetical protein
MSEISAKKAEIEAEFKKITKTNQEIDRRIGEAKSAGDEETFQSLLSDLRTMKDREDMLQAQYSDLMAQEERPKLEKIQKLGEELRQPTILPIPNYMGMYGLPNQPMPDMSNVPSVESQEARKREIIGELYNAPVGAGGTAAEQMPSNVRGGIGALPTPESELEYIKRTYPNANITPITVGGNTEFLVKDANGKVLTTLDKGIAGAAGMLAVEAPVQAIETAATLGTLGFTKSPMAATAAGAGARLAAGTVADVITREVLDMPQSIGENLQRRGIEAAIGAGLGVATDVIPASVVAARKPGNFSNEFFKAYQQSVKNLGLPPSTVPAGAQFGPQGLRAGQELAGEFPRSSVASAMRSAQESVRNLFDAWKSKAPVTPNDFSGIAVNLEGQRRALTNSIKQANNVNERVVEGALNRLLQPPAKANIDELGNILQNTIKNAEDQAIKATNDQYAALSEIADNAGFQITASELLDKLPAIKTKVNPSGAFDDFAVKGVVKRLERRADAPFLIEELDRKLSGLKKMSAKVTNPQQKARLESRIRKMDGELQELNAINKPLNFNEFDQFIRAFNDARPDGGAVGGTTKDVFGAGISSELSALRREIYSNYNATMPDGTVKNLGDEFQKASELVRARGAFEKNTLGSILKEAAGEQATTPRAIVNAAMKEPFTINRVLQAAKELETSDPAQAGVAQKLQNMMRVQYFDNIGMSPSKGTARLNYDANMLGALYGADAPKVARSLDSLNEQLKLLRDAELPKMSLTDLNQLSSALSKEERDAVAKGIIKRNQLERQEENLVRSEIFKAAKKGDFKNIDPDALSASILSDKATIRDVEIAMAQLSKLSPESRNLFKDDFRRSILNRYPGGEPSVAAPYTPLFDAEQFIKDYNPGTGLTPLGQKIKSVLGEEDANYLFDLAKVYEGNTIRTAASNNVSARAITTPSGPTVVFPLTQVAGSIRRRYLAALLGKGSEKHGLKKALAKNALPGDVNDAYNRMFKNAFLTRQGLTSLAHQASSDPEFSAELVRAAREFEEKEGLNLSGQ